MHPVDLTCGATPCPIPQETMGQRMARRAAEQKAAAEQQAAQEKVSPERSVQEKADWKQAAREKAAREKAERDEEWLYEQYINLEAEHELECLAEADLETDRVESLMNHEQDMANFYGFLEFCSIDDHNVMTDQHCSLRLADAR